MWLRALAPAGFFIAVAVLFAGPASCGRFAPLPLIEVQDLTPREVELGDRIVILGAGFPAGRSARLVFRGSLYRPGERPERHVAIDGVGVVVGPNRIELPFAGTLEGLFCRTGDRAAHTTFEGDVEVAFAAATPGASPVAGVLPGVTIDVRPSAATKSAAREQDGQRLLAYLGLHVTVSPDDITHGAGLVVDGVAPHSRAEQAGIAAGDVVSRFNGVRVASPGDILATPGEAEATIVVRRAGGASEVVRVVGVDAFREAPSAAVVDSALAVFGVLVAALLWTLPVPPPLARALDAALRRGRGVVPAGACSSSCAPAGGGGPPFLRARFDFLRDRLPPVRAPLLVDAATWCALAVLPFGQYLLAAKLDAGVLFVGAAAGLAAVAALGEGSPVRGARAALHVLWQHVPATLAVASAVLVTGSLRVRELTQAQGGWPWEWLAFRGAGSLLATWILVRTARIDPSSRADTLAVGRWTIAGENVAARPLGPWGQAAVRAHRRIVMGLVTVLFLGGWALPERSAVQKSGSAARGARGGPLRRKDHRFDARHRRRPLGVAAAYARARNARGGLRLGAPRGGVRRLGGTLDLERPMGGGERARELRTRARRRVVRRRVCLASAPGVAKCLPRAAPERLPVSVAA